MSSISPRILIKGAGEMASAVAWRLYQANLRRLWMTELDSPLCVRRTVSFCSAIDEGRTTVEGVSARLAAGIADIEAAWSAGEIAVVRNSDWPRISALAPEVVIDATMAKRNLGTTRNEARVVIALGPGFEAGRDCHFVVETNRGHDLGRVIAAGSAEADTGVPGDIAGHTAARVIRAPAAGVFAGARRIGEPVQADEVLGEVSGVPVRAPLAGVLRGMIRNGARIAPGLKIGDVDPRGEPGHCFTISDKARSIAGGVLEAILRECNAAVS